MSGPYPPSGYPNPPEQGGWSGDQQQNGQFGAQHYEFPAIQYGGLAGSPGGWGEPPRKPPRSIGRLIVAVVSVLVIIGGVATAAVLLDHRHDKQHTEAATTPSAPATTVGGGSEDTDPYGQNDDDSDSASADPDLPNGSTSLNLTVGACVSAQAVTDNQYRLGRQVSCGSAESDLVLAVVSPDMAGCADHDYLRVSAPSAGVYCFTLDVRPGDCLDTSFLKSPCTAGAFTVLTTEPGPGGADSCTDAAGATHWVPIGHDPVAVACIGPAKNS